MQTWSRYLTDVSCLSWYPGTILECVMQQMCAEQQKRGRDWRWEGQLGGGWVERPTEEGCMLGAEMGEECGWQPGFPPEWQAGQCWQLGSAGWSQVAGLEELVRKGKTGNSIWDIQDWKVQAIIQEISPKQELELKNTCASPDLRSSKKACNE